MERVKGIEPSLEAWEASVLPLNYTRAFTVSLVGLGRFDNMNYLYGRVLASLFYICLT